MENQRTTEWIADVNKEYHERQFDQPYRSTVAFCDWLQKLGCLNETDELRILDLCAGQGANVAYMGTRFPDSSFIGVDFNADIVERGNVALRRRGMDNCQLECGDLYDLKREHVAAFDGIVSYQTLSWLPECEEPIRVMASLDAPWIALTSLFFDGPVSCTTQIREYDENLKTARESFYNVYSLPVVQALFRANGYTQVQWNRFEIDVDLPKPNHCKMGTYTETLEDGRRLQVSGPLLMPWFFLLARKG